MGIVILVISSLSAKTCTPRHVMPEGTVTTPVFAFIQLAIWAPASRVVWGGNNGLTKSRAVGMTEVCHQFTVALRYLQSRLEIGKWELGVSA